MPQLYFTVRETGVRYIDPISQQIIQSLIQKLGVRDYFAQGIFINNQRSSISVSDDGTGQTRMGNNRLDVDIETHYNPTTQFWQRGMDYNTTGVGIAPRWKNQYESIFADPAVGVSLQELTVPFGLTMTFRMTFKSYDAAQKALDRVLSMTCGDIVNETHDIVYTYPLDMSMMGILSRIYKSRSSINSQWTFYQYMNNMSRAQMSFEVNRYDIGKANPDYEYVVKKQQIGCQALMQCDQDAPEPEMQDKVSDAWTVSFTYKFQAGRPQNLQLTIPIMIEQSPLPNVIFDKPTVSWCDAIEGSMQNRSFNPTLRSFSDFKNGDLFIIRFPRYDDWHVPDGNVLRRYHFNPILIGVTPIEDGVISEVDLNELGDVALSPIVKEILQLHTADDLFGLEGIFNVTIFSNDVAMDRSRLTFDPETLKITYTADRMTNIYRVVLSEAMGIKTIHPKFYTYILNYRYFFPMTVFRSLDYLIKNGSYRVTTGDMLLNLVSRLMTIDKLDDIILVMISRGWCGGEVFQYTQTAAQFADYISNTRARQVFHDVAPEDYVMKTLFDVFCDVLIEKKVLNPNNKPQKYLQTPQGYPYGPERGGWQNFNLPFRVLSANLSVTTK